MVMLFGDAIGFWANECRETLEAKKGKKKSPS